MHRSVEYVYLLFFGLPLAWAVADDDKHLIHGSHALQHWSFLWQLQGIKAITFNDVKEEKKEILYCLISLDGIALFLDLWFPLFLF